MFGVILVLTCLLITSFSMVLFGDHWFCCSLSLYTNYLYLEGLPVATLTTVSIGSIAM